MTQTRFPKIIKKSNFYQIIHSQLVSFQTYIGTTEVNTNVFFGVTQEMEKSAFFMEMLTNGISHIDFTKIVKQNKSIFFENKNGLVRLFKRMLCQ